jgi:hypothetical protein
VDQPREKNPAAVAMGKLSAASRTPEQRRELAAKAGRGNLGKSKPRLTLEQLKQRRADRNLRRRKGYVPPAMPQATLDSGPVAVQGAS